MERWSLVIILSMYAAKSMKKMSYGTFHGMNLHPEKKEEMRGIKKSKTWQATSLGVIKEVVTEEMEHTKLGTDLNIVLALARRGAAMEMANLLSRGVHEKLCQLFIREFQREAPEGYGQV